MKSAGKARNNGLYRHIRTSKEIIRNLLNDYNKNKKGVSYCKTNNVIKKEKLLLKRNNRLTNIRKNYLKKE